MDDKYYVYKYYVNDQLLYVGRTNNFVDRFKQHLRENPAYNEVTRIDIATFDSDGDMMIYEKYYITKFHPPLNKKDMQFSSPSFELPEPEWTSYSREEFNNISLSTKSKSEKQIKNKVELPKIILPDNTVSIPDSIPLSWFKQFDMNTQIFDYNKKYSIHFETPYDTATPGEQKGMYKWDKNEIINYWCLIAENKLDKIPYIKDHPYDAPKLNLTIKKNNHDIIYYSLNWIEITLDKSQGFYYFGSRYKNPIIDEHGIFHIEKKIQEYETMELLHTPAAQKALNDTLGMEEYDVEQIISWEPLYITYKNNNIDIAIIKVCFLSTGYEDCNFITNLLIINQGDISYSDHMTAKKYAPCGVLQRYKNTFIRDKRFEDLLIDKF